MAAMHAAGRLSRRLLDVPADVRRLAEVRAFIRTSAADLGASQTNIGDMVQAVDECLTNTIVHGYRERPGRVQVEVTGDDRELVVRLRDEAPAFDPTSVPPAVGALAPRPLPRGGMGIHLARELTDSMTYRRTERGNELTLVKGLIGGVEEEGNADDQG